MESMFVRLIQAVICTTVLVLAAQQAPAENSSLGFDTSIPDSREALVLTTNGRIDPINFLKEKSHSKFHQILIEGSLLRIRHLKEIEYYFSQLGANQIVSFDPSWTKALIQHSRIIRNAFEDGRLEFFNAKLDLKSGRAEVVKLASPMKNLKGLAIK